MDIPLVKLNVQVTSFFLSEQLNITVPPEHTLNLQMTLTETTDKETELFPHGGVWKGKTKRVGRQYPGEGQKCMANTDPIKKDDGGLPWWRSG